VTRIKTEVSGNKMDITRPNVRSIPCCILIWSVSSRRATTGCSRAQEADSAPASHPESSSAAVQRDELEAIVDKLAKVSTLEARSGRLTARHGLPSADAALQWVDEVQAQLGHVDPK
jgi:hypothetical protein